MGVLIPFHDARASARSESAGRGTASGQGASGQWSENHCIVRSSRPTLMSAPSAIADSFLPSLKARELTVVKGTPSILAYARATVSRASMLDMGGISVSLPGLSTAILPEAAVVHSGHSTGMTKLEIILHNVERILVSRDLSANETGVGEAIRNMRRKVRKGLLGGSPRVDVLMRIAAALKTDLATLTNPPAPPAVPEGDAPQLREFLLEQRAVIDRQIAALDAAAAPAPRKPKRKAKPRAA